MPLHIYFNIVPLLLLVGVGHTIAHLSGGEVIAPDVSLPPLSAPPPTSGGESSPGPSRGWGWVPSTPSSPSPPARDAHFPLVPRERTPNSPSPSGSPGSGDGIPFISSNPAVPLPTGVTDTATVRPLPTPGDRNQQDVVGSGSVVRAQKAFLVSVMMFSAALILWM